MISELTMKLTNEVLGHALLRIGLGLDFLAHWLARIGWALEHEALVTDVSGSMSGPLNRCI